MDDPEIKTLLLKNLKLAEENNKLLLSMRRAARWASVFSWIYWLVILGGLGVSYYYIQPYLVAVLDAYQQIQGSVNEIKQQQNNLPDLGKLLDTVRGQPR